MKRSGIGQALLAAALAAILSAPCIGMALRETKRQEFQSALDLAAMTSLHSPPIALQSVRQNVSEYRRVRVRGRYDHAHEVLIGARERGGEPGLHVVTPLRVDDGALLVLRGWIPERSGDASGLAALREAGEVTIEGIPLPARSPASELGADDSKAPVGPGANARPAAEPRADEWPLRVDALDVAGLERRLPYPIFRSLVQQLPQPELSELPQRLPVPDFDDAAHARNANAFYTAAGCLALLPFGGLMLWRRRG